MHNKYFLVVLLNKYIHYFIEEEEEEEIKNLKVDISRIKLKCRKIKRLELIKETLGTIFKDLESNSVHLWNHFLIKKKFLRYTDFVQKHTVDNINSVQTAYLVQISHFSPLKLQGIGHPTNFFPFRILCRFRKSRSDFLIRKESALKRRSK